MVQMLHVKAIVTQIVFVACCHHWASNSVAELASSIVIPFYGRPDLDKNNSQWQYLIETKRQFPNLTGAWVVAAGRGIAPKNPNYQAYVQGFQKLKEVGFGIMAYLHTRTEDNSGKRPLKDLHEDIDTIVKNLGNHVKGIFFDNMNYIIPNRRHIKRPDRGLINYYRNASDYAKKKGLKFTVGNGGPRGTQEEFVNCMDTILIYEGMGPKFPNQTQYGGWHAKYPPKKWGVIPWNVSISREEVRDAKKFVKYIFASDQTNPSLLPTYLAQLFNYLTTD